MTYGMSTALAVGLFFLIYLLLAPRGKRWAACLAGGLACAFGLCCARILYYLVNIQTYAAQHDFIAVFRLSDGGFSIFGALLGAFLGTLLSAKITSKRGGMTCSQALDLLPLPMIVFVIVIRVSTAGLLQGGFGAELGNFGFTERPEGFFADLFLVHSEYDEMLNLPLMEVIAGVVIGLLVYLVSPFKSRKFLWFVFLYGISQVLFDSLRSDRHMVYDFVSLEEILAFAATAVCVIKIGLETGQLAKSILLSLITCGLSVAMEFAIDGRIKVPLEVLKQNADLFWYIVFILIILIYLFLTIKLAGKKGEKSCSES